MGEATDKTGTVPPPPTVDVADGKASRNASAFTWKSIGFGLAGALGICLFAGFNDEILGQTLLVGNHFPLGAYGLLLLWAAGWNPFWMALSRLRGGRAAWARRCGTLVLSRGELAVASGLSLVACWAPTSGLGRFFARMLVMPWVGSSTNPSWGSALRRLPETLYPAGAGGGAPAAPEALARSYEQTYLGFVTGHAASSLREQYFDWPWRDWLSVAASWGPVVLAFACGTVSLALFVHRQWSRHEQLAYSLSTVADEMIRRDTDSVWPTLFRSRLFHWGVGLVTVVHGWRYARAWRPSALPDLSLDWWIPWDTLFPTLRQSGWFYSGEGHLFFVIVGIVYFLPGEIGLTVGISPWLLALLGAQCYAMSGAPLAGDSLETARFGAWVVYGLIFLWVGRHWYWRVVRHAVRPEPPAVPGEKDDEREGLAAAAVGFRGTALSLGVLALALWGAGMDALMACVLAASLLGCGLVFARVMCETGLPFFNVDLLQSTLLKALGYGFVGARSGAIALVTQSLVAQDPRETLQPYAANALRTAEHAGVGLRRFFRWLAVTAVLAAAVSLWVRNSEYYRYGGASASDQYAYNYGPANVMRQMVSLDQTLAARGGSADASGSGWSRFARLAPEKGVAGWLLLGAGMVAVLSLARGQWRWWPIHPVLPLIWSTYAVGKVAQCFLLGWVLKTLVIHLGGGAVYARLKPFFLGLIVGDLAFGGGAILVGVAYYLATGHTPVNYLILPQ